MQRGRLDPALLLISIAALLAGLFANTFGRPDLAHFFWTASAVLLMVVTGLEVIISVLRKQVGVDLIALLSIAAGLWFSQFLVVAVIAVMLASGRSLEFYTSQRAERELRRLIQRAPTFAWRLEGESLTQVPLDCVMPGQRILVRMGEVIPLDGVLVMSGATVDESALTGEPIPVGFSAGATIRSGSVNVGAPFTLQVTHRAGESTYAGIVRMAEAARRSKAPFVRAADRYALMLIPVTLLIAGIAWVLSGDPLRALAVVVVSTPCPLILAVPIAILSGISRCARRGILVKDGATLEAVAQTCFLMLDKTGTLTTGRPCIDSVETTGDISQDRLLYLAASLAQASTHPVSSAIAAAAQKANVVLGMPTEISESAGAGLKGLVDGQRVEMGSLAYLDTQSPWSNALLARLDYQGAGASFIAVDGKLAGAVVFSDQLRVESAGAVRALKHLGVEKVTMLSGDRLETAQWIAIGAGIDEVRARLAPEDKVRAVQTSCALGTTMMVGDGINDAPALAAADIGVAMGAAGASAASEAAGIVLLVDRLDRVAHAMEIARRSCRIARESMFVGMGLSTLAMLVAAAGYLPPLAGAVVQECIDVGVILNALRALTSPGWRMLPRLKAESLQRLGDDHQKMAKVLKTLHRLARDFNHLQPERARTELRALMALLDQDLLPHEQDDENRLYPMLMAYLHGDDPLAALSHTHREIFRLVNLLEHLSDGPVHHAADFQRDEIHTTLIRLDTLLTLHFSQENEMFDSLDQR
ncbi:ATPase, P-type (transporting), HAD superfamily, subfamily IC/heavy metal translocating P-type ATPase [Pseudomonas sp. NFACC02]|uniref:heavy metal translocating P-type ATPase n=1 Tax=Pseudomonas sp. NFACC02 TaxID=1566250 RepID=UPI0008C17098|nr:heavy metal translocating P-type ATPase [Pseudomonas sp. NFACC02]SEQ15692.1 ATPase, P-type (transporting), HAD superfamily, subfamily IC/heavy metal translocating P-type ATPase [Pseudomonas sp. NFACC02]